MSNRRGFISGATAWRGLLRHFCKNPASTPKAPGFPPGAFRVDKYWSPVNRVDNVYGDRHLICSCPPLESYMDAAE